MLVRFGKTIDAFEERHSKKITVALCLIGTALAAIGVIVLLPQWTRLPRWTVNVSYMSANQLNFRHLSFALLVFGVGTFPFIILRINKVKSKIDISSRKVAMATGSLLLTSIILLIIANHSLKNLHIEKINLPGIEPILAVRAQQLHKIIGLAIATALTGSIGLYGAGRLIHTRLCQQQLAREDEKSLNIQA